MTESNERKYDPRNKFSWSLGDVEFANSNCPKCVHLISSMKCKAFPEGIPPEMWKGIDKHTSPATGDHGIQFEAK